MTDQRATPRLQFPVDLSATLSLPQGDTKIIDCTPRGLRFAIAPGMERPKVGERMVGAATFASGHIIDVSGRVVWTTSKEVGVELDPPGIPDATVEASVDLTARPV